MSAVCKIEKTAENIFFETGYVKIGELRFYREVRELCEKNRCRGYGASWACPPAVGTLEECKARVEQYDKMLLFSNRYELEDSFDFEGMQNGMQDFKRLVELFDREVKGCLQNYLLLSNEGCGKCGVCTYPDAPCRFPELLYHSLEGYGFIVNELAHAAGIRYNNGADTVTYFGALLFRVDEKEE